MAAGLNFHSTSYTSLVIALTGAMIKGEGTINGAGQYGFQVTAVQADVAGGDGSDKFRIKIWDKASGATVYDNQSPAVLGDGEIEMRR